MMITGIPLVKIKYAPSAQFALNYSKIVGTFQEGIAKVSRLPYT